MKIGRESLEEKFRALAQDRSETQKQIAAGRNALASLTSQYDQMTAQLALLGQLIKEVRQSEEPDVGGQEHHELLSTVDV